MKSKAEFMKIMNALSSEEQTSLLNLLTKTYEVETELSRLKSEYFKLMNLGLDRLIAAADAQIEARKRES